MKVVECHIVMYSSVVLLHHPSLFLSVPVLDGDIEKTSKNIP